MRLDGPEDCLTWDGTIRASLPACQGGVGSGRDFEKVLLYYCNQAVNELVSALLDDVKKQALLLLSGPITAR